MRYFTSFLFLCKMVNILAKPIIPFNSTDPSTFPSNSNKSKQRRIEQENENEEELDIPIKKSKIISKKAKTRKKSFIKRLKETVLGDDSQSIGIYIIHDVLVPALRSTVHEMITGAVDMAIYGEKRSRLDSRRGGYQRTSYNQYYTDDRNRSRTFSQRARATHDFEEIILDTRTDAVNVIHAMGDLIYDYGQCTVSDLYEFVDITPKFTDNKYGWTELGETNDHIKRVHDGYLLYLPRPIVLK